MLKMAKTYQTAESCQSRRKFPNEENENLQLQQESRRLAK